MSVHIIDSWPGNALKVTTRESVLKPGQWQHVLATYDGSAKADGVKIYVNGNLQRTRVEQNSLVEGASIRNAASLKIGQRSQSQGFRGAIQDVRIYSRHLEPSEVRVLAGFAAIRTMLAQSPNQQTPKQREALLRHFLESVDEEYQTLTQRIRDLEAEREAIRSRSPVTHIQQERADSPAMAHILVRGEYDRPADEVAAATPAALHPMAEDAPKDRLGLAMWLVDPTNPLTARVSVNRFWQQGFGRGIVATPEDFGVMGAPPSHPDLLDWLAVEFVESGWEVKRLFKLMLTSATYRQSAAFTAEKLERDRDNSLLSRGPRFRMDAEMVRDHALETSGLLSDKMYGPSVKPYQPGAIWNIVGLPGGDTRKYKQDAGEDLYRRSLYTFWKRMAPPPNMEAFNSPSREVCTIRRERTNTPLQALVTLNDPIFVEAARHLAQNALTSADPTDDRRHFEEEVLNDIAMHALGRPLKDVEQASLLSDKHFFLDFYRQHPEDANALTSVGDSPCAESIDVTRLAAWTMVCNQVLNLDEALCK